MSNFTWLKELPASSRGRAGGKWKARVKDAVAHPNQWANLGYTGAASGAYQFAKWLTKLLRNMDIQQGRMDARIRNGKVYFSYRTDEQ